MNTLKSISTLKLIYRGILEYDEQDWTYASFMVQLFPQEELGHDQAISKISRNQFGVLNVHLPAQFPKQEPLVVLCSTFAYADQQAGIPITHTIKFPFDRKLPHSQVVTRLKSAIKDHVLNP
jgi:hypothetical protein